MFFSLGLYFTQTYVDPKVYMNIASGPSPWRPEVLGWGLEGAETNHIVSFLLHHFPLQLFLSY